ncbi:MAG: glycosyltransferase family 39 protein, partial [Clostridia bacterium]|nr:glycosyltransferase family 39 protein [Clostridia bacterium]
MAKSKKSTRQAVKNQDNSKPQENIKSDITQDEELKGFSAVKKSISENKLYWMYFSLIGIIFLLTRLVQITVLPKGLHIDEISMGYNTWTLSEFGTDRYGVSFPVYFNNAGSGQSSLYVYIAFLLSKIFGYSVFTLRVVSVIFGSLLLIFGTKTAYEMFGVKCAVITAAVIDIMPFFIMSERWAFDCNAMLPMFVMFLYFFVRLIKTGKNKYALISGVMFGMSMYSYILAVLMMPVFLVLSLIYAFIKKKITLKQTGLMFISAVLVSVPIILYLFVVIGVLPEFKIGSISFTSASAGRASEIVWQSLSFKDIIKNITTLTSYDKYDFMADDKYGVFYNNVLHFFEYKASVSQILLFVGFVFMLCTAVYNIVKKKSFSFELMMMFYLIAVMYPMLFLKQLAL